MWEMTRYSNIQTKKVYTGEICIDFFLSPENAIEQSILWKLRKN